MEKQKIIFSDLNKNLLKRVKEVFNEQKNNTHCELIMSNVDVLKTKKKYPNALIVTASNPKFNACGGLDLLLSKKYPEQWKNAREFKFEKDLFFVVSCDKNIKSSRSIIKRALLGCYFASRKNDIILTGIGTSIAGLSEDDLIHYPINIEIGDNGYISFSVDEDLEKYIMKRNKE
jgi:hypothetical protein